MAYYALFVLVVLWLTNWPPKGSKAAGKGWQMRQVDGFEIAHKSNSLRNDISKKKLKERAVELRRQGRSYRQIGEWLGVHFDTVRRWVSEFPTVESTTVGKTESSDGKQRPSEMPTTDEITESKGEVTGRLGSG